MKNQPQQKPPIFDIPASVWKTVSFMEVEETFDDMLDADLIYPPFHNFCVRSPVSSFSEAAADYVAKLDGVRPWNDFSEMPHWAKKHYSDFIIVEFDFREFPKSAVGNGKLSYGTRVTIGEGLKGVPFHLATGMPLEFTEDLAIFVYKLLITLLATKNCDRKVVENTPRAKSKKAREDSKHYSTTTYISIGRITETCRSGEGSRGPVRAHLRRGHVRRQRYGEGRSEVKTIFIPPVFVNADREWIADRKKYKLVA